MLTKEAFNALLKTLEEPPEHVKFIFATTETEKVPATILSRCQRYDFRNIPTRKIADHLQALCKAENVQADADAIFRIAGAGQARCAISLACWINSSRQAGGVTDADVIRVLGTPSDEQTLFYRGGHRRRQLCRCTGASKRHTGKWYYPDHRSGGLERYFPPHHARPDVWY